MRGLSIRLAVVLTALLVGRAEALVIDFDTLPEGKIVTNADLPAGYTLAVDNRNSTHPDKGIIFDSACPPGNVATDCSGGDPDLMTPGPSGGIGNDRAQKKILIIAENVGDTSPANGLVDNPDDEARGGTMTFTLPAPDQLLSLRVVDIDNTETATKLVLQLSGGGTTTIAIPALGNNSAQTVTIPDPVPTITSFKIDCAGSCGIDDIVIGEHVCTTTTTCSTTTTVTSTTTSTTTTTTSTTTSTSTTTTTIPPGCGDGKLNNDEECDEGVDNSDEPDATCRLNCTLQRCGDGIVDTGEVCDDGPGNSDTTPNACRTDCTLPRCGDGVIDTNRLETCDPPPKPNAENCANQLDDDGDGFIDCADTADCPAGVPKCGFDCKLATCTPVQRDPAVIRFDADRSGADMFWMHGNFRAGAGIDFTAVRFAVMLTNENGIIYQGTLVPGEFKRKVGGKGRYVFHDRDARTRGAGDTDGIYRVTMRGLVRGGYTYVHFRLRAYGDFSSATVPLMTTQIAAGDHVGSLEAEWRKTSTGWVLRLRDFGDLQ